mmetsp:Transcript_100705/g.173572  ORF Transcript_100705/g.173572 Transcript_100705/m.173572 type:complete len:628 (+) Transcript_100705:82-1965(+)
MPKSVNFAAEEDSFQSEIQRVFESQTNILVKQLKALEEEVLRCASMQMEKQAANGTSLSDITAVVQGKAEWLDQPRELQLMQADFNDAETRQIDRESVSSRNSAASHNHDSLGPEAATAISSCPGNFGLESMSTKRYETYKNRDTVHEFKQLSSADSGLLEGFTDVVKDRLSLGKVTFSISVERFKCVPSCIRDSLQHLVEHPVVVKVVTLLIILNAGIMAVEADDTIKRSIQRWQTAQTLQSDHVQMQDPPQWFATADWIFAFAFTIECICRLLVYEVSFFANEAYVWNWLDFIVVVMAWAEIALAMNQNRGGMPPLRLLRLIRVIRSIRMIRSLRFFAELRLLLLSLAHHVKPLMWSVFTLCLMMFMFANVFLQLLSASLYQHQVSATLEGDWSVLLTDKFASFSDAMVSLFALITGGDSWLVYYQAFNEASTAAGITLLIYMGALILGVLNVISAVFVEAAMSKAKSDHDICLGEAQLTRKEMASELIKVFHKIDIEDTGHITWQQWMDFLSTETGEKFILLFEVELMQARKMYEVLDDDGDGEVVIEEFVTGFMQICGSVNKLDVEFSAGKTNKMMRKLNKLMSDLDFHLGTIQSQMLQIVQSPAFAAPPREDLQRRCMIVSL